MQTVPADDLAKLLHKVNLQMSNRLKKEKITSAQYELSDDEFKLKLILDDGNVIFLDGIANKSMTPVKIAGSKKMLKEISNAFHNPNMSPNLKNAKFWKYQQTRGDLSKQLSPIYNPPAGMEKWGLSLNDADFLRGKLLNIFAAYAQDGTIDMTYYGGKRTSKKTRKVRKARKGTYRRRR